MNNTEPMMASYHAGCDDADPTDLLEVPASLVQRIRSIPAFNDCTVTFFQDGPDDIYFTFNVTTPNAIYDLVIGPDDLSFGWSDRDTAPQAVRDYMAEHDEPDLMEGTDCDADWQRIPHVILQMEQLFASL